MNYKVTNNTPNFRLSLVVEGLPKAMRTSFGRQKLAKGDANSGLLPMTVFLSKIKIMLKYFIKSIQIAPLFVFLLTLNPAWAQSQDSNEARFNNARELMDLGKYGLAMQAFKPLTSAFEGNRYEKISSFYYAVSAYNDNQKFIARDMFLQLFQKYPTWEKLDEVNLWLTNIYLQEGDYKKGWSYASKIKNKEIIGEAISLKRNYLNNLNYDQLDSLLDVYPSDKEIAANLADKIFELPIGEQDRGLLENIVSVFELDKTKYRIEEKLNSVKKDKYHIAVMLPFMVDEIKNSTKHLSNEFVIELYEGLLIGVSDLKNLGINISLHLYDTKKDSRATARILEMEELSHMDLIIGPLYSGPVKLVSDFAFENQINMMNPLSNNSEITGNNPYVFLFMPSNETIARQLANFISSDFENKNAFIFHGNNTRDSLLAYAYKKEIESKGFTVCHIDGVNIEDAKNILDVLTNTVTIEFDASEFDSLVFEDRIEGNLRISEQDYLVIRPDSIGHVFVASDDPALVANTITGLETRGDKITLVGSERWLDRRVIDLGGLDRLNAHLIAPTFVDKTKPKYEGLNSINMESFNAYPTRNFYIGYEVMMTVGKMMGKMGNLFQYDPGINDFIPGEIFQGALYGSENCNQIVPIIKFENSELAVINKGN